MKFYIAGDHHTIDLIEKIKAYLDSKDIAYENLGAIDDNRKVPLQEIIPKVAKSIIHTSDDFGVLVCGTGAGVEIGANRFAGVRASLCINPKQAEYARVYDNANILCLSSWITEDPTSILEAWLSNTYDGDESRIQMMKDFDDWK